MFKKKSTEFSERNKVANEIWLKQFECLRLEIFLSQVFQYKGFK